MRINLERLRVTAHAWKAMRKRDITPEELAEILRRPAVSEPHKGCVRLSLNGLTAVVATDPDGTSVVVTVLSRNAEQWTDRDVINRR
ncbi:hypothetical protein SUDANB148_02962 [Streptomyces sp. SudanB148_2056]|uniref:DUF4258 domain-containing protein n=1 Tax=Streptomyces sp. SudanB148_2056 TaxID=3035280 RepID=UPI003F56750A